jgi:branched-subunit amino acid ABC-type transport system permease component
MFSAIVAVGFVVVVIGGVARVVITIVGGWACVESLLCAVVIVQLSMSLARRWRCVLLLLVLLLAVVAAAALVTEHISQVDRNPMNTLGF